MSTCMKNCIIIKELRMHMYKSNNYHVVTMCLYVFIVRFFLIKCAGRSENILELPVYISLYYYWGLLIILFPEFNIRLYDKNSESEYFFQQHWESEYFFRKKNVTPPGS